MKNQFIITVAFIAIFSFTNELFAQATNAKAADLEMTKSTGLSCTIVETEEGCSLNFTKIETAARELGSGMATGKRQHKPLSVSFEVSATDNSVREVISPKDAARGLPTGKRQHKPVAISNDIDKSSPMLAKTVGNSVISTDAVSQGNGMGRGKVNVQDFHFMVKGNGKTSTVSCPDGSCVIPTNLPDGSYSVSCSWSWGMSQSGGLSSGSSGKSSPKKGSADFLMEIQDGVCMAINQKGTGASNK